MRADDETLRIEPISATVDLFENKPAVINIYADAINGLG